MQDANGLGRKKDLDGLRGVAVLLTILLHYVVRSGFFPHASSPHLAQLLDSAWAGVDIFFVLSGFLIGGIILDHGRTDGFLHTFYVRRGLRILPVALLAIAFSYLILPVLNPSLLWSSQVPPWAYLLFINNFWTALNHYAYVPLGPMWSLAIEEQFYLLIPALLTALGPRTRNRFLVVVMLVSPALRLWHGKFSSWDFTLYRLDGFAAGILIAALVRDASFMALAVKHRRKIAAAVAALAAVALAFASALNYTGTQRIAYGISMNSLATASLILLLQVNPGSLLARLLSHPCWVIPGRYSYFLYLMHMPILFYVLAAFSDLPKAYSVILAFAVTFTLAWASWRFVESRAIALGRKYPYGMPPRAVEAPVSYQAGTSNSAADF